MKIRKLLAALAIAALWVPATAHASTGKTEYVAVIPPGSDVLIGYFRVNYSSEYEWIEAWNSDGVSTVRVVQQPGAFAELANLYEVQGEGLLVVAADRSSGTVDADIPGLGHLYVQLRFSQGNVFTPERSGPQSTYSYELLSLSGQLTPPSYSYTAYIDDRRLVEPRWAVFGRDAVGYTRRAPV